ncbi:CRISPR-associated nuclease/helicase Cas3 [Corynebacterium atrinae]|uniref:CRISPR-associated helicase Cas3' n=1 Tax=Corynebacterium atrinae TaxID=1336740 RepID=UPI0025B3AED1|nr:CRISPR-associated helicase Cas3' [Corynebacterium atrinae]WJY64495.1 CRISPR-associated nuclease/helicase Cas3 [Corynebacterium atrinae]
MSLKRVVDTQEVQFERMEQFLASASDPLKSLWAKSGDETGWLPLVQHLADASCVAGCLWDNWMSDSLKRYLADKIGVEECNVRTLITFVAGTHDVGKATMKFARQIELKEPGRDIVEGIADAGIPLAMSRAEYESTQFPHGLAGEVILKDWLVERGCPKKLASSISSIVGAHHGVASQDDDKKPARALLEDYPQEWKALQVEILEGISRATGIWDVVSKLPKRLNADSTMLITGLIVMADWIASNADAFPMVVRGSLSDRVREGMDSIDLTSPWNPPEMEGVEVDEFFRHAFGWPATLSARPIQKAVFDALETIEGSCLAIIEAPTGEGKTEAALGLGQMLAARSGAQGLLLATPTMGTSNGLFSRTLDWAERSTPESTITSMNLVHSRKRFSAEYEKLRWAQPRGIGEDTHNDHGSVVASQWLNGPKKALLSNFVVATVDQVLMMVLQMRHSMLRHMGLAGKIIIIDEVHSYDLYMGSYLKLALRWLARYRVSVILLSATLPGQTKSDLIEAYSGESSGVLPENLSTGYPLLTVADRRGIQEFPVVQRPTDLVAEVSIIPDGLDELESLVADLYSDGGCLLIICNTVRRAQETYHSLASTYPEQVELHHSAFMAAERAQKEDKLREELGPHLHRGEGRPTHRIVVSTQVAEQSLDIDADVLISDIAPMDLLIQRIGRIHRHVRPESDRPLKLQKPKVFIRAIEQKEPVPKFEAGSAAVYEPAILLSTLAKLPRVFRRPDDAPALVQSVYSPDFEPPEAWTEEYSLAHSAMVQRQQLAELRAKTFQIPYPKLASGLSQLFERYSKQMEQALKSEEAGAAQVRDTDPTFEVVPIIATSYGYRVIPFLGGEEISPELMDDAELDYQTAFRLASSVLRLPSRFSKYDRVFDVVIEKLEKETPVGWKNHYLLKGQVALRLDESGEIELDGVVLRYSSERGLEVVENRSWKGSE